MPTVGAMSGFEDQEVHHAAPACDLTQNPVERDLRIVGVAVLTALDLTLGLVNLGRI